MSWLFARDVLPGWMARPAPPLKVTEWLQTQGRKTQYTIANDDGRLGTMWTDYTIDETSIRRTDLVFIERFPLPIAPLRVTTDAVFQANGILDEFTVEVEYPSGQLTLHGERFHSDFSFTLADGPLRRLQRTFKFPLTEGTLISDALSPFSSMAGLEVGQHWRIQVFNPVAVLTGLGERFRSVVVKVTGREFVSTNMGRAECFVLEALGAKAWVDDKGTVHRQEVELGIGGRIRIDREPLYDEDARAAARRFSFR
ncbi:MAG: hypothetical protein J5J06_08340 [Phycisphaerae bacterium]|nr:hypothetical protein [Phycisphaerae bacterium]